MITDHDMSYQISITLGGHLADYSIPGILTDILSEFGRIDIDEVPSERYWQIVARHDSADCYMCGHPMSRHLGEHCTSHDDDDDGRPCRCTVLPWNGEPCEE